VAVAIEIIPVRGVPEIEPGDELGAVLAAALREQGTRLHDDDVVAVTQKVVSKAEGRIVPEGPDGKTSWVERETRRVVARRGDLVIVETHRGLVCANAGVDASNVADGYLTLLPEDPDGSAERIRKTLVSWSGADVAVVITDTFGRPWREGLVNVAIGCAGLPALVDLRGTKDAAGRVLESTVEALADEIAAASGLVMGKADGIPAAVIRGMHVEGAPLPASALVRPPDEDLFRESSSQALLSWGQAGAFAPDGIDPALVQEALLAAGSALKADGEQPWMLMEVGRGEARARVAAAAEGESADILAVAPVVVLGFVDTGIATPSGSGSIEEDRDAWLLSGGAALQNLVLAFHALGLASRWIPPSRFRQGELRRALGVAGRPILMGAVAAGRTPAE
jgi:dehydro coenzyme F420 reductase / coenzyme F420-0:L-glutamate ligase / coenzyme F420-1:gamma-L-glutamate ligase